MAKPLKEAAAEYKQAFDKALRAKRGTARDEALAVVERVQKDLCAAALAGCHACGRPDTPQFHCQCENDE